MFRIAVIGGGIGGLFATLAIHHHCQSEDIQIDVYEQATQYTEIGAGVGLGPNAAKLFQKIGLLEDALAIAGKRTETWFKFLRYDDGAEVLTISMAEQAKTLQLPVHRAELLDMLVEAIKRRKAATLHTKKQCRTLEDRGDSMLVTFADGTTTTANLVIGADGIHSAVRACYVDDSPVYGGMVVYRALCPISKIQDTWPFPDMYATISMARGKHFLTFPISQNQTLNIVGFVTTPWEKLGDVQESWTLTTDASTVREEFKEFNSIVQTIMKHMDTNPLRWILFDREPLKEWCFSGGKVALLGDAAHAMCPHQGAGAGQAVEDGYILGRVLQDYLRSLDTPNEISLHDSLQIYQSVRQPRAVKVQATSRQAGELYELQVKEVAGLSYDESLPVVKSMLEDRMKWIWNDDIDKAYEDAQKHRQRASREHL